MSTPERDEIAGWFAGRLPDGWFTGAPSVTIDEGQIVVVGTLTEPALPADASALLKAGAEAGRISRFRESTRPYRIHIAREAEHRFELPVTWGATSGGTTEKFTPGGSGRSQEGQGGEEAKKVRIAWRHGWHGGRGRRAWHAWQGDQQSF
jgi:hypothetical protein